jgi:hypothetical protein
MDEVAHSLSQISYALGGSEYVETDDDDIIRWSNHPFGYFNVSEEDLPRFIAYLEGLPARAQRQELNLAEARLRLAEPEEAARRITALAVRDAARQILSELDAAAQATEDEQAELAAIRVAEVALDTLRARQAAPSVVDAIVQGIVDGNPLLAQFADQIRPAVAQGLRAANVPLQAAQAIPASLPAVLGELIPLLRSLTPLLDTVGAIGRRFTLPPSFAQFSWPTNRDAATFLPGQPPPTPVGSFAPETGGR